jgi:hypothetical protein
MNNFIQKNDQHKADAVKYFSRVADSFSALLMSVHSSIRDRFFDVNINIIYF